ncbi:MAG TPA: methylenetetrahydrofolate reductase, partial [Clostridia bacterium]|nr:methylenetetrahydrofolate reductase [Clostridia bacterium]
EVEPPRDSDASRVLAASFDLKRAGVDAVTVPDSPLARMRMDSLALAACIIQEIGMPAIPHITCRDKNINAIQSGVLAAHYLGIRNVLAVTGDSISNAAMVKPVFNVSSFGLVQLLNSLNEKYFKGDEISLYGAVNVNAANFEKELDRASIKVNHGAEALFTQPIHSQKGIEALKILKKAGLAKTIAGLMPIVSKRNALFLAHEFPGFLIPEDIISRFSDDMSAECNEKTALDITVDIAKQIRDYSDGFYIIVPFARTSLIIKLIERLKRCGII